MQPLSKRTLDDPNRRGNTSKLGALFGEDVHEDASFYLGGYPRFRLAILEMPPSTHICNRRDLSPNQHTRLLAKLRG